MKEQEPCRDEKCMELSYYSNKTEIEEEASKRSLIRRRGLMEQDKSCPLRHLPFTVYWFWIKCMVVHIFDAYVDTCYIHKINFEKLKLVKVKAKVKSI